MFLTSSACEPRMSTTLPYFAFYLSRAIGISPPMTIYVALERLFRQSSPSAHEIVLGFRNFLSSPHMAASSNNRHLATLRSVTKLGRMLGMTSSYLEVAGVKGESGGRTMGTDDRRCAPVTRSKGPAHRARAGSKSDPTCGVTACAIVPLRPLSTWPPRRASGSTRYARI